MKRIIIIVAIIYGGTVSAQIKPDTTTRPAVVANGNINTIPAAYGSNIKLNYVRVWEATRAFSTETEITATTRTVGEVKQTTQYFDGLGRPLQTVVKGTSPSGKDMVNPVVYDQFGREVYKYLPYVQQTGNNSDGKFKTDAFNSQASFYGNSGLNPGIIGEQVFYSKTAYEKSPLGRPDTVFAPGNSWGGNQKGIVVRNEINGVADSVLVWSIDVSLGSVPTTLVKYDAGQLYKTVTVDEHEKQVIEFKDKEGQIILKKVQIDTAPSTHHAGWLCTYYVYDDFGQLRFVIPPKAIETIAGEWVITTTISDELCFRYEYDERNRMIIKKVPGAGEVKMVYDARDRLVLTQDARMAEQNNWTLLIYDNLNRQVRTGLFGGGGSREWHQVSASSSISYLSGHSYILLTENYFDNYNFSWSAGLTYSLEVSSSDLLATSNTAAPFAQPVFPVYQVRGLLTGTKVNVLNSDQYLYSLNIYDKKQRVIETKATNLTADIDRNATQYDFAGKPLRMISSHKINSNDTTNHIITNYEYDLVGRITKTSKILNGSYEVAISRQEYNELGQLKKKQLGQVADTAGGYLTTPLETLDYTYNIRGWLIGINRGYANPSYTSEATTQSQRWFGMQLSYDYGFAGASGSNAMRNGNISGIRWRSNGSDQERAYGFKYDAFNRLMSADFNQNSYNGWSTSEGIDYSMRMGDGINPASAYDANGNILKMWQKGLKLSASNTIDSLLYSYQENSNKLSKVTDGIVEDTRLGDFKDGINEDGDDYEYDVNGNMVLDHNKKITQIFYNHLNLPDSIMCGGEESNNYISYSYDANGVKLQKRVYEETDFGVRQITSTYIGPFVYESSFIEQEYGDPVSVEWNLQFMGHEEGRFRKRAPRNNKEEEEASQYGIIYWNSDYFVKDHLGNVRMVLTDERKTDVYLATMESANDATENLVFQNRVNFSGTPYCFDNIGNGRVQRIGVAEDGNTVLGTGILLKVMAGDHVNPQVLGWYNPNNLEGNNPQADIEDVLAELLSGKIAEVTTKGSLSSIPTSSILPGIEAFLSTQSNYSSYGSAHLNWMLFDDEQLQLIADNSGFTTLTTGGCSQTAALLQANAGDGISVDRNGYLFVYLSNTNTDHSVYFDNLYIEHIRGPLLEETHYYPFGLVQQGISSKAASFGGADNTKKFTSQELDADLGWNTYQMKFRTHDPQTGRFLQVDPLASIYVYNSTYAYAENDVIRAIDIEGLEKAIMITNNQNHHASSAPKSLEISKKGLGTVTSANYSEKRVLPSGLDAAQNVILDKPVENMYKSVSETITTTSTKVEELEGYGKVLAITQTSTTTTANLNGGMNMDEAIKEITQTSTTSTSYTKVVNDNSNGNSVKISLDPKDSYTEVGKPTTTTLATKDANLGDKLKALSPTLKNKVVDAAQTNVNAVKQAEDALKEQMKKPSS